MNKVKEANIRVQSNHKYSRKLKYKHLQNIEKANAIREWLNEKGFFVPDTLKSFKARQIDILTDKETGEYQDYENLFRAYYDLMRPLQAVLAEFTLKGTRSYQLIMSQFSRNKIDSIFNYKKSKSARRTWIEFLKDNPELIHDYYPMHLTLTVPHKGGKWRNKEFFSRELIKEFNLMRKEKAFKSFVYGGVYNVETTKSKSGNGNHTHLHALVFQRKKHSKAHVSDWIKSEWSRRTGASEYLIHYQNLFVHRKDEKGRWIVESIPAKSYTETDANGLEQQVTVYPERNLKKRFELSLTEKWYRDLSDTEKVEQMSIGILETIKYHFKEEAFLDEQGNYDVDFINEILNEGKGLRFYSKFGAFYGVKELNINNIAKQDEPEQTEVQGDNEDFNMDVNRTLTNTFNPITKEKANWDDVNLKLIGVKDFKFITNVAKKTSKLKPNQEDLKTIDKHFDLKEIAGLLARGKTEKLTFRIERLVTHNIQIINKKGKIKIHGIKDVTNKFFNYPKTSLFASWNKLEKLRKDNNLNIIHIKNLDVGLITGYLEPEPLKRKKRAVIQEIETLPFGISKSIYNNFDKLIPIEFKEQVKERNEVINDFENQKTA